MEAMSYEECKKTLRVKDISAEYQRVIHTLCGLRGQESLEKLFVQAN